MLEEYCSPTTVSPPQEGTPLLLQRTEPPPLTGPLCHKQGLIASSHGAYWQGWTGGNPNGSGASRRSARNSRFSLTILERFEWCLVTVYYDFLFHPVPRASFRNLPQSNIPHNKPTLHVNALLSTIRTLSTFFRPLIWHQINQPQLAISTSPTPLITY